MSLSGGSGVCENITIFEVDDSSSVHADDRINDILIIGKSPTDRLDDTA